MNEMIFKGN